ncbi:dTDP-4-dehydrorhamnose reductase [Flavihumibacter fluvii]|uniref:dTDP-4-dehydrorhamnose reductase n=1 Tax=Flavihumibacter fluvii TaxID=2838157 RepID=UPI001BDE5E81|nr:dTDP-4-dehydrorhamnose reductase [Flavihumibacter fluvii]ULQ54800.1 dTDP-4-dehydrorhamnose reductase [Flavihumibacter fluvii]
MKKILVTGANGQLGSELRQLSALYGQFEFLFTDSKELPVHEEGLVKAWFKKHQPHYCINCAAYTAVDKAETEPEKAMLVNGDAVGFLAKACAAYHCRLVHISTDYVFDGTATTPIEETATVHPLGVYGRSKLRGEQLALSYLPDAIIIRTSWVYSVYGNNFVKTMIRLMAEKKELNVVNDQFGSPTYAADLAKAIADIIAFLDADPTTKDMGGTFHYSNSGMISWYDFAVAIRDMIKSPCEVHPIPGSAYPTPAKRPAYSVLNTNKISAVFHVQLIPWKDSLQACLLQMQQYLAG